LDGERANGEFNETDYFLFYSSDRSMSNGWQRDTATAAAAASPQRVKAAVIAL